MKMIVLRRLVFCAVLGAVAALSPACGDDESGADPSQHKKVEVALDRYVEESGLYFGDFWKEGYANYYF